jgi:hypothetical protein
MCKNSRQLDPKSERGKSRVETATAWLLRATARDIQDGRWIAMDAEQEQFLEDGTFVLRWQLPMWWRGPVGPLWWCGR